MSIWRTALWAALGAVLIFGIGWCSLAHAASITCFPAPDGPLPSDAERYEAALAERFLDALSHGGRFPLDTSGVVAWPRPDGMVAVIILRGSFACPMLVPHGDYEAARRTALGVEL